MINVMQAKTTASDGSSKANAIEQFLGIECSSETKCAEVSRDVLTFTFNY